MAEETQYTANIGMVTISTANAERNGTGTMGDVITGALNGTLVRTVKIKAQTNTTEGTIRLFIYDGTNTALYREVHVSAITKSSRDRSFEVTLNLNFFLKNGYILKASTQIAETFNIIAIGLDQSYYTTSVRTNTIQLSGGDGLGKLVTANSNLDGSGTLVSLIQAGYIGGGWNGSHVEKIHIIATGTTTPGMIRLFIRNSDNSVTKLYTEIQVPAITPTAATQSFESVVDFNSEFFLQIQYKIVGSTEKAESFVVISEGMMFKYQA
ncbi:MAG: hypothetical protein WAV23_03105 [Minisyncoccia bacterium]